MLTLTDAVLEEILLAVTGAGGSLDPTATYLGVATAIVDAGQATDLADITEATGAMATRIAVTPWGTPYKMQDGRWCRDSPKFVFRPASAAESQTIVGHFLADASTAGNLLGFDQYVSPYPLPNEDRALSIIIRVVVDPDGRWGVTQTYNG